MDNVIKLLFRGAWRLAGGPKQSPGAELPREPRPLQRPPGRWQGRGGGLVLDIRYTAFQFFYNLVVANAAIFGI